MNAIARDDEMITDGVLRAQVEGLQKAVAELAGQVRDIGVKFSATLEAQTRQITDIQTHIKIQEALTTQKEKVQAQTVERERFKTEISWTKISILIFFAQLLDSSLTAGLMHFWK
jgi:hypothetical protein